LLELDAKSDRVQDALAFARNNLRQPLTVEQLAEAARLSPRQFTRVFRAETGQSPARAVENLRLEAARYMLEQGRLPVEEIAQAQHLPNAQLIMYPDANHGAYSQYAENFLENARLFLNG
jgi:transcriptional regulator GlxA family with amidase domain